MPIGGMVDTRTSFNAQTKVLQRIVSHRAVEVPPWWPNLLQEVDNDPNRSFMDVGAYAELGYMQRKDEGAPPVMDQPFELIPEHFVFSTWALMSSVSMEAENEDPINFLEKLAPMLTDSETSTKDVQYTNVINQGFNPVQTMADGQPLFSPNHLLAPVPGDSGPISKIGRTYSNSVGATQFTPESFRQAELLFQLMLSDRALPAARTSKYVLCHPNMLKNVQEVTGSPQGPYTADRKENTQYQQAIPLGCRYLTNENAWYLIAATGGWPNGDGHALIVSHKFQYSIEVWRDPQTRNWNISNMFRSCYGPADWRGVVGSLGAGPVTL